jgi:putative transposase
MDETYIKVNGVWKYLYRAVDKQGKTIGFLLTAKRDMAVLGKFCRLINNATEPGAASKRIASDKTSRLRKAVGVVEKRLATEPAQQTYRRDRSKKERVYHERDVS